MPAAATIRAHSVTPRYRLQHRGQGFMPRRYLPRARHDNDVRSNRSYAIQQTDALGVASTHSSPVAQQRKFGTHSFAASRVLLRVPLAGHQDPLRRRAQRVGGRSGQTSWYRRDDTGGDHALPGNQRRWLKNNGEGERTADWQSRVMGGVLPDLGDASRCSLHR
jgi:hypothetical protein